MTNTLKLTLLGPPEIILNEKPLADFKRSKSQALLFYLAVTKQPHSRDALATLFWQDMPDQQAKKNLRNLLPELNKLLTPYVTITRQSVAFNDAGPYSLDVELFQNTLASSRTNMSLQDLQEATTLYTGDFLEGFYVRDAPAFEEWMLLQREHLRELSILGLDTLIEHCLQQGKHTIGLAAVRRLLRLEPWREKAYQQQMILLARLGERAAALAQYEACRRILAAEFGVAPLLETTAIYQQIRAGASGSERDKEIGSETEGGQSPASSVHIQAAELPGQDETLDAGLRTLDPGLPTLVAGYNLPQRTTLYGRQPELACLQQWVMEEGCRLVGIFGIGGQGKTALAATLVRTLAEPAPQPLPGVRFKRILWQSLLNAPPLAEVLQEWLYVLSDQTMTSLPLSLDEQLSQLLDYLRRQRCLLVLDNLESILQGNGRSGYYRVGYETYGQLLHCLVEGEHASCLMLTSRERPQDFTYLEEDTPRVRFLALAGVSVDAGQAKLRARGVVGAPADLAALVQQYSGNPLALKLAAETVQAIFAGDIAAFLRAEALVFDDIRDILDQQFTRLTPLERELMIWLAIVREPTSYPVLRDLLAQQPAPHLVLEAVRSLQRRSLLETYAAGFGLQNVVLEYTTALLVENMGRELEDDQIKEYRRDEENACLPPCAPTPLHSYFYLNRYALVLAQTKEYVRESQTRQLLQPVTERLLAQLGVQGTEQQLQRLLARLRRVPPTRGYAAANLLHVLLHLGVNLHGYDFSQLSFRQLYLRGVSLPQTNFAQAELIESVFTESLGRIFTVAFSPDGRWLAAGTRNGAIHLWRTADQQLAQVLQGHQHAVIALTFAYQPDKDGGQHLVLATGSEDQSVGLWQVSEDAVFSGHGRFLNAHRQTVIGVGISVDGQAVASVDMDGTVCVWETRSLETVTDGRNQLRYQFNCQLPKFWVAAFSRDGQTLAIGSSDTRVYLWNVAGVAGPVLTEHKHSVDAVAFSPDGRLLVSGDGNGRLCLFTLPQGQCQQILDTTFGFVSALTFAPDGRTLVSSHWDRTVRLWRVDALSATSIHLAHTLVGHTHVVRSIAFSPDGRMLASGGSDQTVRIWDAQTGQPLYTLRGHSHALNAIALSPDGTQLAAVGYDKKVHLWQGSGAEVSTAHRALRRHQGLLHSVTFSPDGRTLASAGSDPAIHLWDVASGQLCHTMSGHAPDIYRVAFHPDGELLASGSGDGTVRLWAWRSSRTIGTLAAGAGMIYALAFSPDGRTLASAGVGPSIHLWDMTQAGWPERIEARKTMQETGEHEGLALAFSPDGTKLACGGTNLIHLWDLRGTEGLVMLRHHRNWVMSLAFSPDGTILASASEDRTIGLWDVVRGELRMVLRGHTEGVYGVTFSQDGTRLLSAGADGAIKCWDAQTGECLNTLLIEGPYAGMNITGVTGITEAQKATLKTLGARDKDP